MRFEVCHRVISWRIGGLVQIIVVVLMFATGCSTSKQAAVRPNTVADAGSRVGVGPTGEAAMKHMIASYNPVWSKVKVPMTLSLVSPASVSASGTLTMERGESIAISLRVLGMEVAAVYLTGESVTVVDRWNKRYVQEDLSKFLAGFPVDMCNVQDILMGRLFEAGKKNLTESSAGDFIFETEGDVWACQPRNQSELYSYAFAATLTTLMHLEAAAGSGAASVEYSAPFETIHGPMATGLKVKSLVKKKNLELNIEYKSGKATWDDDVKIQPFTPPNNYTKVDASSVLKGLSKQ